MGSAGETTLKASMGPASRKAGPAPGSYPERTLDPHGHTSGVGTASEAGLGLALSHLSLCRMRPQGAPERRLGAELPRWQHWMSRQRRMANPSRATRSELELVLNLFFFENNQLPQGTARRRLEEKG